MIDLLASTGIADDLLQRTSSTARVQEIVQLSLAPVFLLGAIGAMLNVMVTRLIWIATRIEEIERLIVRGEAVREDEELPVLQQRRRYSQSAVMFSTAAALVICVVIALLFISAFIQPSLGTATALAWIITMALVSVGLVLFLAETRLATGSASDRRKQSRRILKRRAKKETAD